MRLNTGPGTPPPTALPSSLTIASTSLVEEVSHASSAPRSSDSGIARTWCLMPSACANSSTTS
jgi:hypothetical protein